MNRSKSWLALLLCLGGLAPGCDQPCQTTSECGGGEVCAAALCRELSCETAFFAADPKSGACVALSGCFLTDEQRTWVTCDADPCAGQAENSCLRDSRCQPAYANPDVKFSSDDREPVACAGVARGNPPPNPDGPEQKVSAPGVNNGEAPKHRRPDSSASCFADTARAYAGCRAVPQIAPRKACGALTSDECGARSDCTTEQGGGGDVLFPTRPVPERPTTDPATGVNRVCFDRFPRSASCEGADALSCLTNPACQPIGSDCFCPPGASCACAGGQFIGCEPNDHLRRCRSGGECDASERCDLDEACIAPRTYSSRQSGPEPVPGTGSCLGACVPMGCAGYGEKRCHETAGCDAGAYGTVCRPKPYCSGGEKPTEPLPRDPSDPTDPGAPVSADTCGCETEFLGCAPLQPVPGSTIKAERSLLVRDPEIVSDPAFRVDSVIQRLAPAGKADEFVRQWFTRLGSQARLQNGEDAPLRRGAQIWANQMSSSGALTAAGLAQRMHTTALVNRLDLAGTADCGEARLTFALNSGYTDGNQRLTMIVELGVPDDGNGCRTVAQRWGELSMIDDPAARRDRLRQIYDELLRPERLKQLRTNEFLNSFGVEAWELREWKLGADGLPVLAPVQQTVGPKAAGGAGFLTWARQNVAALKAGTAIVPAEYLAAASTENGARLRLLGSDRDAVLKDAEKALNGLACAGCHLTETRSPFAHVAERLGRRAGLGYEPAGRAVLDEFMQKELVKRTENLRTILSAPPKMALGAPWRGLAPARVH